MREIIIYLSDDGKVFTDELECGEYEFKLSHPHISEIEFYDIDGQMLSIDNENYFESLEKICDKADEIRIPTEDARKELFELRDMISLPCAMDDIDSIGTWLYWRSLLDEGFVKK